MPNQASFVIIETSKENLEIANHVQDFSCRFSVITNKLAKTVSTIEEIDILSGMG